MITQQQLVDTLKSEVAKLKSERMTDEIKVGDWVKEFVETLTKSEPDNVITVLRYIREHTKSYLQREHDQLLSQAEDYKNYAELIANFIDKEL